MAQNWVAVKELKLSYHNPRTILFTVFRGLRPEAGNAGSRGDLSHILLEANVTRRGTGVCASELLVHH